METNGLIIVERIEQKCKEKSIPREKIATVGKIAKNTLSTWKSRGTVLPADVAVRIAQELDVSVEWLVFGTEKESGECSAWEKQLLGYCRMFDNRDRDDIMDMARAKADRYARSSAQRASGTSA